jgi:hypothetical protein
LLVCPHVYDYPAVMASCRDERISRPSAPPSVWSGHPPMLAPRDLERDGTWQGVNAYGVLAAVTNRADIESVRDPDRIWSRGDLIVRALQSKDAEEALRLATAFPADRYNGFNLVVMDGKRAFLARGHGVNGGSRFEIRELPDGRIHIITNHGIGPEASPRNANIAAALTAHRVKDGPARWAAFAPVLDIHAPDPKPVSGHLSASTCIVRPEAENYGTKSASFIRLNPNFDRQGIRWQMRYRERPRPDLSCCMGMTIPYELAIVMA